MSESWSAEHILCRTLVDAGVDVLFGYPGGAIMPFYHALPEFPQLRHILVRHEQAAAHAADGYARASGRVGVCVATSGPGATNLVTGLATASMDSSPVVAITGQVSRPMIGPDAFQETDLIAAAQRPLLMVGHGVILANAYDEVRALAEKTGMPVITTLLGISAFPEGHPLHLGMPGMHGEVHVNRAIQRADVIVAIGLRFDDRVTGNLAAFAPRAQIVHIDVDRSEIGRNVPAAIGIVGDAKAVTRSEERR